MNTICKLADIDTYLLYYLDIKTVISLTTISKDQFNHMTNLDFIKQLRILVQKYGYENIIDNTATHNYISLIKWISYSINKFKYTSVAIDYAAKNRHIEVLEWFANSKYKFKYTKNAITLAALQGNFDVLDWFANSEYEFKYKTFLIDYALERRKIKILKWFDESGYEIKHTKEIIMHILKTDCTDIYEYLGPNSRIIKILDQYAKK